MMNDDAASGGADEPPVLPGWRPGRYALPRVASCSVILAAAVTIPTPRYAEGQAVILAEATEDVVSPVAALVSRVLAAPGQKLDAGVPVIELRDHDIDSRDERAARRIQGLLGTLVTQGYHPDLESELSHEEAERRAVESERELLTLRVPSAGELVAVWVRPGQRVVAGQRLFSVRSKQAEEIALVLPPYAINYLDRTSRLWVSFEGTRVRPDVVLVEWSHRQLIGGAQITRYLGDDYGDLVATTGPAVLARGRIRRKQLLIGGRYGPPPPGLTGRAWLATETVSAAAEFLQQLLASLPPSTS